MPKPNHRAASSAAAAASSPAGRKEQEENTVPAVYDASADIEDDYRLFLENVRVYENEDFVLEYEGKVVRYGGDEAVSAGGGSRGEDPVMEKEKEEKEKEVVVISSSDDESTKSVPESNPLDRGVFQRKMKKVVDQEKMDEKNEAAAPLVKGKGVGKVIGMEVEDEQLVLALPKPGTTTSLTNPSKRHETEPHTTSGAADPAMETDPVMSVFFLAVMVVVFFVVMEAAARAPSGGGGGTAPLPSLSLDHALPDLADGRWQRVNIGLAKMKMPPAKIIFAGGAYVACKNHQSAGIIWPPHINDREESSFKQGLMEALSKPFCQEEYDKLYGIATICEPLMRERRTRSGSKTYYSNSLMGKSYFDSYPGLIEVLSKPFCQEEHDELYGMATIREPSMSERRTRSGSKTYYSNLGWANHILIPTQNIIWVPHINNREQSGFKQGLIEVSSKPFCQEEHDKLYGMSTISEPSMRKRQTRCGSKTYYSNPG
uniref:Uncharacterized protein n=1 Tax=Oryza meridionalis TaxID=40149 RepID=A0A0E0DAV4_9ORYZ